MASEVSSDYSTHADDLMQAGQQELWPENGHSTKMESSLKTFHELPSVKFDCDTVREAQVQSASSTAPLYQTETEQTTRTAAQVTAGDDKTLMLIPPKNSPLVTRQWISEDVL